MSLMTLSDWSLLLNKFSPQFDEFCLNFKAFKKHKRLFDKFLYDVLFLISRTTDGEQFNYVIWLCVNLLHAIDHITNLKCSENKELSFFENFKSLCQSFADKILCSSSPQNQEYKDFCSAYFLKMIKIEGEIEKLNILMDVYIQQLQQKLISFEHVTIISMDYPHEEVNVNVGCNFSRTITRKLLSNDCSMAKAAVHAQLFGSQVTFNELNKGTSARLLLLHIDEKEQDLQRLYKLAVIRHNVAIHALQVERESFLRNKIKSNHNTQLCKDEGVETCEPLLSVVMKDFDGLCNSPLLSSIIYDSTFENANSDQETLAGEDRCGVNNHGYNDWTAVDIWHQKERATKQLYDSFLTKYRQVRQLRLDVDYPEELAEDDSVAYKADMEWWNDHIRFMKSRPDYEPYIAATKNSDAVAFHPELGPWTGPYRELTDSSMMAQYSVLYEKDFEKLEAKKKQDKRNKRSRLSELYDGSR